MRNYLSVVVALLSLLVLTTGCGSDEIQKYPQDVKFNIDCNGGTYFYGFVDSYSIVDGILSFDDYWLHGEHRNAGKVIPFEDCIITVRTRQ